MSLEPKLLQPNQMTMNINGGEKQRNGSLGKRCETWRENANL